MRRECRERFPHIRIQRKPLVNNPGMHYGTCVTHLLWCMSASLTLRWLGKRSRHSQCMRNPQIYVSGKRPTPQGKYSECFLIRLPFCSSRYCNSGVSFLPSPAENKNVPDLTTRDTRIVDDMTLHHWTLVSFLTIFMILLISAMQIVTRWYKILRIDERKDPNGFKWH